MVRYLHAASNKRPPWPWLGSARFEATVVDPFLAGMTRIPSSREATPQCQPQGRPRQRGGPRRCHHCESRDRLLMRWRRSCQKRFKSYGRNARRRSMTPSRTREGRTSCWPARRRTHGATARVHDERSSSVCADNPYNPKGSTKRGRRGAGKREREREGGRERERVQNSTIQSGQ